MPKKHLVLDYDVHLRLQKRKRKTGLSLRSIGNMILRAVLSQPTLLTDAVGKRLVDSGLLELDAYEEAVRQAVEDVERASLDGTELAVPGQDGNLVSGSWELRNAYRSPDEAFQIIEAWAADPRKKATATHSHAEDEHMLVLSGSVMLTEEGQEMILSAGMCYHILEGRIHSAIPLDTSVRILTTFIPAGPLFSQKAAPSN